MDDCTNNTNSPRFDLSDPEVLDAAIAMAEASTPDLKWGPRVLEPGETEAYLEAGATREVWMAHVDDAIAALTGNGPTSEANARFYAHARDIVIALGAEVKHLRAGLAMIDELDEKGAKLLAGIDRSNEQDETRCALYRMGEGGSLEFVSMMEIATTQDDEHRSRDVIAEMKAIYTGDYMTSDMLKDQALVLKALAEARREHRSRDVIAELKATYSGDYMTSDMLKDQALVLKALAEARRDERAKLALARRQTERRIRNQRAELAAKAKEVEERDRAYNALRDENAKLRDQIERGISPADRRL